MLISVFWRQQASLVPMLLISLTHAYFFNDTGTFNLLFQGESCQVYKGHTYTYSECVYICLSYCNSYSAGLVLLLTLVPSAPEGQRAAYGTSEHNSQPCRRGSEKPVWFFPGAALCQELPSSLSTCPCVWSGVFQVWIWEWCCAQALAWFLQKLLLKRRGLYISSPLSSCYTNVHSQCR